MNVNKLNNTLKNGMEANSLSNYFWQSLEVIGHINNHFNLRSRNPFRRLRGHIILNRCIKRVSGISQHYLKGINGDLLEGLFNFIENNKEIFDGIEVIYTGDDNSGQWVLTTHLIGYDYIKDYKLFKHFYRNIKLQIILNIFTEEITVTVGNLISVNNTIKKRYSKYIISHTTSQSVESDTETGEIIRFLSYFMQLCAILYLRGGDNGKEKAEKCFRYEPIYINNISSSNSKQ